LNNPIKGVVLHPQQRRRSFTDWQVKGIKVENLFSKKDSIKLVRNENGCYICTPQNAQSSLKN